VHHWPAKGKQTIHTLLTCKRLHTTGAREHEPVHSPPIATWPVSGAARRSRPLRRFLQPRFHKCRSLTELYRGGRHHGAWPLAGVPKLCHAEDAFPGVLAQSVDATRNVTL
jgi:hypothetical protein